MAFSKELSFDMLCLMLVACPITVTRAAARRGHHEVREMLRFASIRGRSGRGSQFINNVHWQ